WRNGWTSRSGYWRSSGTRSEWRPLLPEVADSPRGSRHPRSRRDGGQLRAADPGGARAGRPDPIQARLRRQGRGADAARGCGAGAATGPPGARRAGRACGFRRAFGGQGPRGRAARAAALTGNEMPFVPVFALLIPIVAVGGFFAW